MLQNGNKYFGNECLHTLLFADDQVSIANNEKCIEYMTGKLTKEYSKWSLSIKNRKSENLITGGSLFDIQMENKIIIGSRANKYL